jgi:phosphoribosyl-AMP cyclohydrolase
MAPAAIRRAFFLEMTMNLDFTKMAGLLPAIIQDSRSGRVLMLGYMNEEAFRKTVATGQVVFYSRSRQQLWTKGEKSGHRLLVKEIATDCDQDTLLVRVEAMGPGVCHMGFESCFFRKLDGDAWQQTDAPVFDPGSVYGGNL